MTCFSCGAPLTGDAANQNQMGAPAGQQFTPPSAYSQTPSRGFSFSQPTAQSLNIIGIVGAVIALIGLFLPFWKYDILGATDSLSLFADGIRGYIALIAAVAGISAAAKSVNAGVIGAGAVVALMAVLEYNALDSAIETAIKESGASGILTVDFMKQFFSTGVGFPVVLVGAGVMVIGGVVGLIRAKK